MNSAWHGNEDIMAEKVDYGTLKKGGFMRQKQKNNFSLRLAVVGGYLSTIQNRQDCRSSWERFCNS